MGKFIPITNIRKHTGEGMHDNPKMGVKKDKPSFEITEADEREVNRLIKESGWVIGTMENKLMDEIVEHTGQHKSMVKFMILLNWHMIHCLDNMQSWSKRKKVYRVKKFHFENFGMFQMRNKVHEAANGFLDNWDRERFLKYEEKLFSIRNSSIYRKFEAACRAKKQKKKRVTC